MELKLRADLNILIWEINFIIKSITRSFIMLNTMMENENTSFAKISERNRNISKTCVSFSIIVFKMKKLLVIFFIRTNFP